MSLQDFELTAEHEQLLRNTKITASSPGLILHDFQTLLDFVSERSPQLSKTHLLPMRALKPLDERLTRRIEHGLTHPQQKSLPHINGLFLLLRASGLTLVDASGRQPVLVVDEFVRDSWNSLNADERFFMLLESWLLRGDPAIIGERYRIFALNHPLSRWLSFFGIIADPERFSRVWDDLGRYAGGLHNLALMELFGIVEVEDGPSQPKKGWRIAGIQATEWGKALLNLLASKLMADWEVLDLLDQPENIPPGQLQPIFQPYRPDWQRNLQFPDTFFQEGTFVFTVSLGKNMWRRITIPADFTLGELSDAILHAYQFDHDHLYRFIYPTRFGLPVEVHHPYMDEGPYVDEVRIGDLPAQPGFALSYHYDFGDDWYFNVVLERIDPPNPSSQQWEVVESKGKSPEQYPTWD